MARVAPGPRPATAPIDPLSAPPLAWLACHPCPAVSGRGKRYFYWPLGVPLIRTRRPVLPCCSPQGDGVDFFQSASGGVVLTLAGVAVYGALVAWARRPGHADRW